MLAQALFMLAAMAPTQRGAEDHWTGADGVRYGPLWEVLEAKVATRAPSVPRAGLACVNVCPTVACPRTCPPEGENWEIRVTYKPGVTGPATVGGCFGAIEQVVCYQLTHVTQKGVTETLDPSDPRCAPGLAICHRNIHPGEILETYGVRVR